MTSHDAETMLSQVVLPNLLHKFPHSEHNTVERLWCKVAHLRYCLSLTLCQRLWPARFSATPAEMVNALIYHLQQFWEKAPWQARDVARRPLVPPPPSSRLLSPPPSSSPPPASSLLLLPLPMSRDLHIDVGRVYLDSTCRAGARSRRPRQARASPGRGAAGLLPHHRSALPPPSPRRP
jgi:hypothetical protein